MRDHQPPPPTASPPERRWLLSLALAGVLVALAGLLVVTLGPSLAFGLRPEGSRLVGQAGLLLGAALAVAGLGAAVFGPVARGPAAAAVGYGSHRVILSTTLFATLLAALVGTIVPLLVLNLTGQRSLQNVPAFLAAALSVAGVLLGVAYFRFIRPGVVSLGDFGFGRNRLAPRFGNRVWLAHLVTGAGGWLLILTLSAAIQLLLKQAGVEQTQLRDYAWVRQAGLPQFALIAAAGALLAPLAEEVFFRGIVFGAYLQAKGPLVAYLVSASVFALLHLNLPALPPILLLGMVLAWLYRATGSLTPGLVAHGINNSVAFSVLYFFDSAGLGGG